MRLRFIQRAAAFVTTGALLLSTSIPASAQQVRYYHLDAIGSVRAISNASGVVVERHDYLPFGEECTTGPCAANPGVGAGQPRKFTGKERDTETGLDYFGARYYGSKIGRFTTVDPVQTTAENLVDPQRWNRYSYANNNPLRYVDPDGRVVVPVAVIIALAVGWSLLSAPDIANAPGLQAPTYISDQTGQLYLQAAKAVGIGMGVNYAEHLGKAADGTADALRRGRESEARVLDAIGEVKNTERVRSCEGCSIPDFQNPTKIGEIKDAARVSDTRQIRIQRDAAKASGREHVLVTGTNTNVAGTVERRGTTVIRRDDLGPPQ